MIAQYKPNERDKSIIDDITAQIKISIPAWYGAGASLDTENPEIRSYRNSFILRYPVTPATGRKKAILVKIRRNPKMDSLWRAIEADIHANIPTEYRSLKSVFSALVDASDDFGVIRPLDYIQKYSAIVMEEFPSRTLRQILIDQRSSKNGTGMGELRDAARKTGRWLHNFHHQVHTAKEIHYSTDDVLDIVRGYATRLETYSRGRIQAQQIVQSFARKLQNVRLSSMVVSESHADMTCDNVLYSDDKKVCVIDIKTRLAPIYSDLGLILTHPETFKSQIFSGGTYLPESLLTAYRSAILAGYFENEPMDETMVKLFSAIKILDKWTMYEELMHRYKGVKHLLAIPIGPFVSSYFHNVLNKHLNSIETVNTKQSVSPLAKPIDSA